MSTPNKDPLLSDIAQFLKDEQEIYGSFAFTADEEEEILRSLKSETEAGLEEGDETNSESGVKADGVVGGEKSSESEMELESETIPESEVEAASGTVSESKDVRKPISETTDQLISSGEPDTPKPVTLKDKLEACQNLDQLRTLCAEADELRTHLKGTNLVFGVGNPNADLMLIGEAPGEQEDKEGEPFVGAAGQLLNKILAAIDFKREEVYIANILKHRPPGNRNPNPEERLRSLPYLLRQIDLIQPKLILCLGKVSGTTLLDREDSLKNLRGEFYPFRDTLLTVTYHPAALLRNPKWKRPVWEDVQKVKRKVGELVDRE